MVLSRNFEKSYLQMTAGWKGWLDKHMPNCKRKEKFKERVDLVVLSTKGNLFYRYILEFMHRIIRRSEWPLNRSIRGLRFSGPLRSEFKKILVRNRCDPSLINYFI